MSYTDYCESIMDDALPQGCGTASSSLILNPLLSILFINTFSSVAQVLIHSRQAKVF